MKVALQLYSIRDILPGNIEKCIAEVAEIGYDGVEIVNFGGDSLNEIVSAMRNNDLQVFSIHTDIHEVIACDAEKLNYYAALGCRYMPISALPDDRLPGGDKYEETLCAIRNFSETAQGYGIKLLYHNHDFDFEKAGGRYKLDILYSDLPASILGAERSLTHAGFIQPESPRLITIKNTRTGARYCISKTACPKAAEKASASSVPES